MKYFLFACLGVLALVIFLYQGLPINPIHDFNLWKLEKSYAKVPHPDGSVVLSKKAYLGGSSTHGSQTCNYVDGELRRSSGSEEDVRNAYTDLSVTMKQTPVKVLFLNEAWPPDLPWPDWESDAKTEFENSTGTVYLVYAANENPFWGDLRCDD